MAQRTDGHHFETKVRRTKRTYPKLSNSSDEENSVDRSDTRGNHGNQEDNANVSDQDKSELNSTLEVDVETSFSASPVSTGYDLRSRRPVHGADSVGKTKGSPKKSRTPTTSPGLPKKLRTPTTVPAHTSPFAQGRDRGNTQPRLYPDLSESLSPQRTYDRTASASPSPRVNYERRHVVGSPGGDEKKTQGDANRFISHVCLVCLGLAVAVLLVWFVFPAKKAVDLPPANTFSDRFKTELLELEQKFPNQNRRLWKTLKAPMRRVLTGKSDRPAVLLFAAVDSNQVTSNCIAKHYAEIITRVFKATSDIRITSGRAGNIKMFIDRSLRSGFSSGSKVALISDLHKMPADPAMLFHAFCDNENAPYKEVAIIFTLHVIADNSYLPQPPAGDTVVEDYLDVIWSKMDVNDRRALISRIANSVVIASAENSEVIRRHCM